MDLMLLLGALFFNLHLFVFVFLSLFFVRKFKSGGKSKKRKIVKKALLITPVLYLFIIIGSYFVFYFKDKPISTPNNTVIILGSPADADGQPGMVLKGRLDQALEIYRKADVKNIIVTGGAVHNTFSEAGVMKNYLVANGVVLKDIIIEEKARNTYENALYTSKILDSLHIQNPIIVTSHPHVKRSKKMFSLFIDNFTMETRQPSFLLFAKLFPVYVFETALTVGFDMQ